MTQLNLFEWRRRVSTKLTAAWSKRRARELHRALEMMRGVVA
jgi:hypothetical protein